ncbi:hypothetical protein [Cohnella abietis]|uniref:IDEAL domain-containing protein n=1 Tax=Cohnella abietis TaxID=2507935 RepID=A0A3T1D217_9BACL|nr:hypothetical protein [Cohnella abietis]BBI32162.1 hypothetical protein KCTCHS21_15610 [Cohnella abietis]
MKVEVSDWVQATTKNGEFIHGFVDAVDEQQGIANIFVVNSDNEESVGKPVAVRERLLRKLPAYVFEDTDAIQSLIDIALSTKDEQWFNELSEKWKDLQQSRSKEESRPAVYPSSTNRINYPVWNSGRNRI